MLLHQQPLDNETYDRTESVTVTKVKYIITRDKIIYPKILFYPPIEGIRYFILTDRERYADYVEELFIGESDTLKVNVINNTLFVEYDGTTMTGINSIPLVVEECPLCKQPLDVKINYNSGTIPVCVNKSCEAVLYVNTNKFMDIVGIKNNNSVRTVINRCIARNIVKSPVDIFFISKDLLLSFDDINEKKIDIVLNHLMETRDNLTLSVLLHGLFYDCIEKQYTDKCGEYLQTVPVLISFILSFLGETEDDFGELDVPEYVKWILSDFFNINNPSNTDMVNKITMMQLCY